MAKLVVYDVSTDELRPATQADIDRLAYHAKCYGSLRSLLRQISEVRPDPELSSHWDLYEALLNELRKFPAPT